MDSQNVRANHCSALLKNEFIKGTPFLVQKAKKYTLIKFFLTQFIDYKEYKKSHQRRCIFRTASALSRVQNNIVIVKYC